ncbi:MAG: SDR family oxidoreductase [Alphaproteobacteria bacterium]
MTRTQAVFLCELTGFVNPAIARRLQDRGAAVTGADPALPEDGDHEGVPVLGWASPATLIRRAAERMGRLDAAIISPAMPAPRTPVEEIDADTLRPYFERIAIASLAFAAEAAKVMRAQKSGRIVFGSSAGPIGGIPGAAPYAAARAAVNGAVRTLALELAADNITVNAVAANFIQTETYYPKALLDDPAKREKLLGKVPARRLGDAEEVAELVEFLALGRATFLTGQVIPIAGGWC